MQPHPEELLARRRLRRRVGLWRTLAIVAGAGLLLALIGRFGGFDSGPYIARLEIAGIILDDPERTALIDELAHDPRVHAVIVRIDSPGGTATGAEALYEALRRLGDAKPVVVSLSTLGTSAAYWAALAGERIFARASTVTGSIGVIVQTVEITALLDDLGIAAEEIRSGALKGQPSPFEPMSAPVRAATQALVDDMHALFVERVAERRGLAPEAARALADGRVFTGRQALEQGLVDALGGEREARAWLAEARGLAPGLPLRDVTPDRDAAALVDLLAEAGRKAVYPESLRLDGVVSVWHPGWH